MARASGPRVAVIGKRTLAGLPVYADLASVPPATAIVVVEASLPESARLPAALQKALPGTRVIAWLESATADAVQQLFTVGFEEVAVGERHCSMLIERALHDGDFTEAAAKQTAIHNGLVELIAEIAKNPDLQQVLKIAVLRMSELFGMDRVSVVIFDQHLEVGFVVMEREQAALDNIVISISDYPELQEIIQTKSPLIISDVFGDALLEGVRSKLTAAQQPHRAAVLFPLVRKEQVVGALFLRNKERFAEIDEGLLTMGRLVASVTSVAIGHALEQDMLQSEKRALMRSKAWADEQLAGLKELREFLDQAKDGMLVTDHDGIIRYANAAAATILKQALNDLSGRRFLTLLLPHCHTLAERALRGDAVGDENGYVDLIASDETRGDGKSVVISAAIRPLTSPEGVFISFRDVTELREIESELRQTKEFLENLIQSSADAIIATDTDGQVILFNRAAEEMLGYEAREVVGRANMSAFYTGNEERDVMRKLRSEAYGGPGRLRMMRTELVAKNGEAVPVNLTAAIIYEGTREVATMSILSDLRERRRIEEKLSQVQRRLQMTERQAVAMELAGVAAHELNQPLTSILGYAEMLKRRVAEGDASRKAVEVICRETERMATIVRKIGQITKYQTKPYVGSSQILDIGEGGGHPDDDGEKPGG